MATLILENNPESLLHDKKLDDTNVASGHETRLADCDNELFDSLRNTGIYDAKVVA